MGLQAGQSLGPYEIVSVIGAGGMGEVYRARDNRLGRDVAIKVLPDPIGANPDSLARFEREAKAVAALSHPNILAIHDFGRHEGTAFAVVELLEGETLRDAIAGGALPQRKAIEYARQTARGLGAAHASGIVHRDVKPENLFVTRDGRIKILDFGLARSATEISSQSDDTPTFTHLTGPGTVLGTINYMSPEQARGDAAGPASDIFSLGSVLYEMLEGQRPFERETAPETMTAILREDPPELGDGIGPAVRRIVQRCLEKRPEERFQSAHDLAFALETSSGASSTGVQPVVDDVSTKAPKRTALWPAAVGIVIGLIAGGLLGARLVQAPATEPVKISPISFSGYDGSPAASPDGRTIAFSTLRAGGAGIWVKQLQGGGEAALTLGQDNSPRFSPDGSTVLFIRSEGVNTSAYRVPLVGGEPRKLVDGAAEADWSPDGSQVVFTRMPGGSEGSIGIANADGSGERLLITLERRLLTSPRWSPDGATIAFRAANSNNNTLKDILLLDVATKEIRELSPKRPSTTGLTWSGDGRHLVYGWSDDLLPGLASSAARISMQDVTTGETEDLFWVRDVMLAQAGTNLDIAGPGRLLYGVISTEQNLREVPLEGNSAETMRTLTSGTSADRQPIYSPDGTTILFSSNRSGTLDLWTINTETGALRQLTDDEARDWDPAYSADGSKIVWSSDRSGNLEIWIANADGSGARQVSSDGQDAENPGITPDGEWIVYMTSNPDKTGMWKVRADGTEATQLFQGSAFISDLSPDGRHVAFLVNAETNINEVRVMNIETGEMQTFARVSRSSKKLSGSEGRPRWFPDGNAIAYIDSDGDEVGVVMQDFVPGRDTSATRRKLAGFEPEWISESFGLSPDGKRIVLSRKRPGGTVMLAENVPQVTPPVRD